MVLASYSGETEDTVAALRFATSTAPPPRHRQGRRLGDQARGDHAIEYGSAAIFEAPIAALLLLAAGMSEGTAAAARPRSCGRRRRGARRRARVAQGADAWAEEHARAFLSSRHLYVLGAGPLSPLAYKVALTVVMENIRIGGTWIDASEWRHGPAEALERSQADALMLVGTDPSRPMCQRSLAFLREHGARTLVIDAADYAGGASAADAARAQLAHAVVHGLVGRAARDHRPRPSRVHGPAGAGRGRAPLAVSTFACLGDCCLDVYVEPVARVLVGGSCLNVAVGLRAAGSRPSMRGRSATTRRAHGCSPCSPSTA